MTDTQADNPAAPAASAVDAMSFEDALRELEAIVETLEQGRGSLDDAIAAYERGAALKKHCQTKLEEARLKVEKIKLDESGQPSGTTDFDA